MNIDMARDVVRTGFRSASALSELLPALKEGCSPAEYKAYALGIAVAIDTIMTNTTGRVLELYPNLGKEIDEQIAKHGRYR